MYCCVFSVACECCQGTFAQDSGHRRQQPFSLHREDLRCTVTPCSRGCNCTRGVQSTDICAGQCSQLKHCLSLARKAALISCPQSQVRSCVWRGEQTSVHRLCTRGCADMETAAHSHGTSGHYSWHDWFDSGYMYVGDDLWLFAYFPFCGEHANLGDSLTGSHYVANEFAFLNQQCDLLSCDLLSCCLCRLGVGVTRLADHLTQIVRVQPFTSVDRCDVLQDW